MTSAMVERPGGSSLVDVVDTILDKGLVIDAYVRISALGIELITIDARIVVASVDTYLHYAEAVNRLDLTTTETQGIKGLTQDLTHGVAKGKVQGALEGGIEAVRNRRSSDDRAGSGRRS